MDVPQYTTFNQLTEGTNWDYYTEPEERSCLSLTNKKCRFPRGTSNSKFLNVFDSMLIQ